MSLFGGTGTDIALMKAFVLFELETGLLEAELLVAASKFMGTELDVVVGIIVVGVANVAVVVVVEVPLVNCD